MPMSRIAGNLSPAQTKVIRGLSSHPCAAVSASELGDPDLQWLITNGYVKTYWGSGGVMWAIEPSGRALAVELGMVAE